MSSLRNEELIMKRIAIVFVALFALSFSAFAENSVFFTATAIPSPSPDELRKALNSPKDRYGIPGGIYGIDSVMKAYKKTLDSKENQSAFAFWSGVAFLPIGYYLADAVPDLVWAPYGAVTGIPYGYFVMGVGAGFIIWDLVGISPEINKLKQKMVKIFASSY
jgi:hypothetical protein